MNVRMVFYYYGPLNRKLDEHLTELGERMGFDWYAQGTDLASGERDITLDAEYDLNSLGFGGRTPDIPEGISE